MSLPRVLNVAQSFVAEYVQPGDCVVDATMGNGIDTVFLARLVGAGGTVFGFDVQEEALARTRERIARELGAESVEVTVAGAEMRLHLVDHAQMASMIGDEYRGRIAAVMFNLGYLPRAPHEWITRPESTMPALESSLALLKTGGIISIVAYPGHEGGDLEAEAVERWASGLPHERYQVGTYRYLNQRKSPPLWIGITKLSEDV
ncbi:MAG: ytqB [Paenibacillaceae bacterium]|jgi:SAM-dependent methyltransferase|nr:ytqB [Paenibacillaceae bacterium]